LHFPDNILPIFQLPHSPELNPIERLWQHLKRALAWQSCKTLNELRHKLDDILKSLTAEVVHSLCGWDFITSALLSAMS
jgi:transposase